MSNEAILEQAIERLEHLTGAKAMLQQAGASGGSQWDAFVQLAAGRAAGDFKALVKSEVLPATLAPLMEQLKSAGSLLVARYISGPARELLEAQGLNYLDMAGNCFIQNGLGIFWLIRGQRLPEEVRALKHEAFHKNGIKLVYALLLREEWLNEPHRFLAGRANIAASTVGDILRDLKAAQFLLQVDKRQLAIVNRAELLAQWVSAYNERLKPKLSWGKFRFLNNAVLRGWKDVNLGNKSFWGGEPAADLLTHRLQPGLWTLYTSLDRRSLLSDLQLVPDPRHGNVLVFSIFWDETADAFTDLKTKTVSPLLVYADLAGSGDSRNLETARLIYEQYLQDIFESGNG
jgi:hypothetical protein